MGMFDEIQLTPHALNVLRRSIDKYNTANPQNSIPIPVVDQIVKQNIFQTKDLENALFHYRLDVGLQLLRYKHVDFVEDKESFFGHRIEHRDPYYEDVDVHKVVCFYPGGSHIDYDNRDWWIDFKAKFSDNVLVQIDVSHVRADENTTRKKHEAEWKQTMNKSLQLSRKWYYKVYKILWKTPITFCVRKIFKFFRKVFEWKYENKIIETLCPW